MSRIITDMEVLKSQMKIIQEAQETALSAHVALCRETRDAIDRSTSTPVRGGHSPVTSPIQQVVLLYLLYTLIQKNTHTYKPHTTYKLYT